MVMMCVCSLMVMVCMCVITDVVVTGPVGEVIEIQTAITKDCQ